MNLEKVGNKYGSMRKRPKHNLGNYYGILELLRARSDLLYRQSVHVGLKIAMKAIICLLESWHDVNVIFGSTLDSPL